MNRRRYDTIDTSATLYLEYCRERVHRSARVALAMVLVMALGLRVFVSVVVGIGFRVDVVYVVGARVHILQYYSTLWDSAVRG